MTGDSSFKRRGTRRRGGGDVNGVPHCFEGALRRFSGREPSSSHSDGSQHNDNPLSFCHPSHQRVGLGSDRDSAILMQNSTNTLTSPSKSDAPEGPTSVPPSGRLESDLLFESLRFWYVHAVQAYSPGWRDDLFTVSAPVFFFP